MKFRSSHLSQRPPPPAVTYTTAGQRHLHHRRPTVTYPRYRLCPLSPLGPPPSPSSRRKTQTRRTPRATKKPRRPRHETELGISHQYAGEHSRGCGRHELLDGDRGEEALEHDSGDLDEAEEEWAGDGGLDGGAAKKTEPLKEEGGIYIRAIGCELLGGDEAPEHDAGAPIEAEEDSAGDGGLDGGGAKHRIFTWKQSMRAGFIPSY